MLSEYTESIVCFLDILGFRKIVNTASRETDVQIYRKGVICGKGGGIAGQRRFYGFGIYQ